MLFLCFFVIIFVQWQFSQASAAEKKRERREKRQEEKQRNKKRESCTCPTFIAGKAKQTARGEDTEIVTVTIQQERHGSRVPSLFSIRKRLTLKTICTCFLFNLLHVPSSPLPTTFFHVCLSLSFSRCVSFGSLRILTWHTLTIQYALSLFFHTTIDSK